MLESVVLQSGALQNPKITQYIAICSAPGWSPTDSKIPLYHLDKKFPRTTGFLDNWYNCRRHQVTNIGKNAIFFHFMIIWVFMVKRCYYHWFKIGFNLPRQHKTVFDRPRDGGCTSYGGGSWYWATFESVVLHPGAVQIQTNWVILESVVLQSGALQIPKYLKTMDSVVLHSGALQIPK